jgi:hypothetical protein
MRLGPLGYHDSPALILAPPAGLGVEPPTRFYMNLFDVYI